MESVVFPRAMNSKNILRVSLALPLILALRSLAFLASRVYKSLTYLSPLYYILALRLKPLLYRITSIMLSNPPLSTQYTGLSGRTYTIEHVLQDEVSPPRQVYRASWVDTKLSLCLHAYTPLARMVTSLY